MIAADKVYNFVIFVANKEMGYAPIKPADFNVAAPVALDRYIQEAYSQYAIVNKISDDLDELKAYQSYSVPSSGTVTLPTDYRHFDNARRKYYYKRNGVQEAKFVDIKLVQRAEVNLYTMSEIVSPDLMFPICYIEDASINFLPKNVGVIEFDYIRNPQTPFYNTTVNTTTGAVTYNPSGSVGFEVPTYALEKLGLVILEELGIRVGDQLLAQYAAGARQQRQE